MRNLEQWIWLPKKIYPDAISTTTDIDNKDYTNYRVCELKKEQHLEKEIKSVQIRFSGDTSVMLYCGDKFVGRAPASTGGDFLIPQLPVSIHYATEVVLDSSEHPEFLQGKLNFYAVVRLSRTRLFEFSQGHGGFFLTAHINFSDGDTSVLISDETWKIRLLTQYEKESLFDNSKESAPWINAERINNIWHCETSPIPPCTENYIKAGEIKIPPGKSVSEVFPLDMIYAGYPVIKMKTDGKVTLELHCREWQEEGTKINCTFVKDEKYEAGEMHSAGELVFSAENEGKTEAQAEIGFIESHFPINLEAETVTSDKDLNEVLQTCKHTLKICRQTLHLDSPRHCELLACTGDYYIESLMTAFSFGDQRLSSFDVKRTAELLRYRDGEMFHTTYSLIWVQMLWDNYLFTGDKSILTDCTDALEFLLKRFKSYIGDTGIIENPVSYMFVDWLYPDGISLHHPPKALGQTCLNMFYYGALKTAAKIYNEINNFTRAENTEKEMNELHKNMLIHLYDNEKELFFEGLNTPTPEHLIAHYMPQNVEKRYYMKHSNILAAYFGFFNKEKCQELLRRIIPDKTMPEVQPYFCHYLFEAVYRNDLREEFTLKISELWKAPVKECPKGLVEGFYKPEPSYSFDHSHAWGGTPLWSVPKALTGMEILSPGMTKISFNPSLLGLESAKVEIPTQFGMITLSMKKGKKTEIKAPDSIEIILK